MTNFQELYKQKLTTPEGIARKIQSGDLIRNDIGASTAWSLCNAICEYAKANHLHDVTLETSLESQRLPYFTDPSYEGIIKGLSSFTGPYARKTVNDGKMDYYSYYYRDLPKIDDLYMNYGTLCAVVSPMDEHGYFSFGATASTIEGLLRNVSKVYLEVNKYMPRTFGGPIIHISQVDSLCENHVPLLNTKPVLPDSKSMTIGNYIAERIPDGSTIQLGIGSMPDAVGLALKEKKHLGIHTEMFTTGMVDLIECGAVDNSLKPIHTNKTVATFAFGSQKVYDFINNNPSVLIMNVDHVNNIKTISCHPNMMSINTAIQVDLYGQVSAESFGTRHISGVGGQVDFVRGAIESDGGQSFITLFSTRNNDTESNIMPVLEPGSIVTTSKNDVDNIVTEYGVAKLRGKTASERAKALIRIAHPKFRDELTFQARKKGLFI